ncbi:LysR family transcriptional regulator [Neisseria arctica]|uniref:LysR family transcriptional regulator n=1 Tax=Neisseria arctica TaxID=1470200 RepID=A0A0J0YS39_9NEIS|nr:LysR family transcriptional regulator [Neisseria arctica]KLT72941.1 LysR family transcriptional regulator [Neisseria arctica]UOO86442.1 LysR family transcriptional regulator [Neisseria arctica]
MDTLFSLKVFREVVQSGSFTRAADKLDISIAMASKHVSHLENTIQAKLLHRNSRNLHLTEAGEEYYRQCSYALETLQSAADKAAGGADKPQGLLRMTMPLWFATSYVSQWFAEYRRLYPEVSLDLHLDNRRVDLIADGVDLALRVSNEPHPSLIVKPLAKIEFFLVASPAYLDLHGTPETPAEVQRHEAVLPSYVDLSDVAITAKDGSQETLTLKSSILSDNTLMCRKLIQAGCGIGYLPLWAIAEDLQQGSLVRLLPDYSMLTTQLYAAYVDRAFLSAKVRSMIDFLSNKINHCPISLLP